MKKLSILTVTTLFMAGLIFSLIYLRPLRIGVLLSTETTLGFEENLLIKYYQSEFKRVGLRRVKYFIENPSSLDETEFREAYARLAEKGVSVILSGEISQTALMIAPLAEETGIPTFGLTSSSHLLSGRKDNFYRVVTGTDALGYYMADYVQSLGYQRVAAITSVENAAYADALADSFAKPFSGQVRKIPFEDARQVWDGVDAFGPDALYCILPETDLVQILSEAYNSRREIGLFSSDWGFMQIISVFSGPQLNGISAMMRTGNIPEEYQRLIADFETLYDIKATFASDNTIAILDMIFEAVRRTGPRAKKLKEHFDSPRNYTGILGNLYMDEFGDSQLEYNYVFRIQDDELEQMKRVRNKWYQEPAHE